MQWKSIEKELKGQVKPFENLKSYTSFKIGGIARLFVKEFSSESLLNDLLFLNKHGIPYKILGNATNLLIKDSLIESVVLNISTNQTLFEKNIATVDAGVNMFSLIKNAKSLSLGGIEFMAGIPGSMGGIIKLNAGAFGNEIGNFVESVMLDDGQWHNNLTFSYRKSNITSTIIKAKIKLEQKNINLINSKINKILEKRRNSQPRLPSAGSIFKKPKPDFYVGKAIEDIGLKGYRVGDAMISKIHAGFIVNVGNATFDDVIKLIDIIKEKIFKTYNINLDLEINIWR